MNTDLAATLAHRFAGNLLIEIGMNKLREVVARNAVETRKDVCHSHDFCDANMTMAAAFEEVTGRDPLANGETADEDIAMWNAAWARAVRIFPLYVAT